MTSNYDKDQMFIELPYTTNYEIFIHDPTFFTLNFIPVAIPKLYRGTLVNETKNYAYPMVMTEVQELDLPQDPCNMDKRYNFQVIPVFVYLNKACFQACVSKGITWKLSCQVKWEEQQSDTNLPPCTTVDQFRCKDSLFNLSLGLLLRHFNSLKEGIANMEMEGIAKLTGCLKPCHYR